MGRMKQVKRIRLFIVISFIVLSGTAFIPGMSFAEKDSGKSFEEYSSLAKQGDAKAQLYLGDMYAAGAGVPQDYKEAARWYRKAAEQGEAAAQARLGAMYAFEDGVPLDNKLALKWFRKSAEQGNAFAQGLLGVMYMRGKGVPRDNVESYAWLNISVAQGFVDDTAEMRDSVAKKLSPKALAKAQELSMEYYKKYVEPFQ